MKPGILASGLPPGHPTIYDVTVRSSFRRGALYQAARGAAGAAEQGDAHKVLVLQCTLRDALRIPDSDPVLQLDWSVPLAFDTLGAPATQTALLIEAHAARIASRYGTAYSATKRLLEQ